MFTQFSKVSNIDGAISVKEAYGEVLVPIIAKTPFFEDVSVDLSARWARYTGSGDVWAYKGGLNWTVGAGLRLRGTYSRDVRAGNLSERFDVTGGSANVNDPKFSTGASDPGPLVQTTVFSGGNPTVKPERADTITAGAIYQPDFLRGFSASLDWYRIKVKDAIGQLGAQAVVNNCNSGQTTYCSLITRDPNTQALLLVGNIYININQSLVEGIDVETSYRTRLKLFGGDEAFSGRAFASWLIHRSETGPTGVTTDRAGQTGTQLSDSVAYGYPRFKLTSNVTYKNGPFSVFVQGRYISPGTNENAPPSSIKIGHNGVTSAYYVDLNLGYTVALGGHDLQLFANVTNLLDKAPPIAPGWNSLGNYATQTNSGLFDVIGRRFVFGARVAL